MRLLRSRHGHPDDHDGHDDHDDHDDDDRSVGGTELRHLFGGDRFDDGAPEETEGGRGPIASFFRLVTLPVRLAVFAVGLVVTLVLLPIRIGAGVVKRTVAVASDITYGLWRGVARIVGLVVASVGFALHVVNATVGGAIRLVLRSVRGLVRLLLGVFRLGRRTA